MAQHLETFLFTKGPITQIEATLTKGDNDGGEAGGVSADGSLGIGSLRKVRTENGK
jgi:hypothetical protein